MTMRKYAIGVYRAARYLVACNPTLSVTALDLQEAACVGRLPELQLEEASESSKKGMQNDPVAVAIKMRAVALRDERKARRPTAEQLRMRKRIMEAGFRHVCRKSA